VDDAAYLRAVCWSPFDDGPRLVYADWLEERGECARAEFVRVQCGLARLEQILSIPAEDRDLCTDSSASWCPNCGDCRCPEPEGRKDDPGCHLHAPDSRHCDDDSIRACIATLRRRERELAVRCAAWAETDGVMKALGADHVRRLGLSMTFTDLEFSRDGRPYALGEFRRGLVGSVTLTTEQFFGGPCGRCGGRGEVDTAPGFGDGWVSCPACHDTGCVEGMAAALFRAAPVTEVRLSDREPDSIGNGRLAWWYTDPDWHRPGLYQHHWLPVGFRPHLTGRICEPVDKPRWGVCGFDYGDLSPETDGVGLALADCSAACVALGRDRAELPALARLVSPNFLR
jgi:uncharacterized protein (TIGR02996 family)